MHPNKVLARHCPTQHMLCHLPLYTLSRSHLCYPSWIHPLISFVCRVYPAPHKGQNSLQVCIYRNKCYLLPQPFLDLARMPMIQNTQMSTHYEML